MEYVCSHHLHQVAPSSVTAMTSATAGQGSAGADDLATTGLKYPIRDALAASNAAGSVVHSNLGLEAEAGIPEIDIKIELC